MRDVVVGPFVLMFCLAWIFGPLSFSRERRWGGMAISIGGMMRKVGMGDAQARQALQVIVFRRHKHIIGHMFSFTGCQVLLPAISGPAYVRVGSTK